VEPHVGEVDGGSGGMGWLIWIAIGLGAKVISWLFQ
jgi:uncharacterized protein HemX